MSQIDGLFLLGGGGGGMISCSSSSKILNQTIVWKCVMCSSLNAYIVLCKYVTKKWCIPCKMGICCVLATFSFSIPNLWSIHKISVQYSPFVEYSIIITSFSTHTVFTIYGVFPTFLCSIHQNFAKNVLFRILSNIYNSDKVICSVFLCIPMTILYIQMT